MRAGLAYAVVAGGVLCGSTAAILVRLAQGEGLPSLTIAAGRLAAAALILTPLALSRAGPELAALSWRDRLKAILSGGCLALHFAAWITSLAHTSVASSAALVSTTPIFVALGSWLFLAERPGLRAAAGIGLSLAGSLFIALSDSALPLAGRPLWGDALALVGALGFSLYILLGRGLRRRVSTLAYVWLVYTTAALILAGCVLASGQPILGFSPSAYLFVLALAVIPQLLGHTAFNWALGRLSAIFIAVALLGEPLGAASLAFIIFGEGLAGLQAAGLGLLLAGICLAGADKGQTP